MTTRKSGITLVELLVVIAVVGALIAILLPAVLAARETARRMRCYSNLRQIALAIHSYESASNTLPPGCYHGVFGTWITVLLPYLEQQELYNRYEFGPSIDLRPSPPGGIRYNSIHNLDVTRVQVPTLVCPSDTRTATPGIMDGITFHNYVGNYGNTSRGRLSQFGRPDIQGHVDFGGAPFIEVLHRMSPADKSKGNYYNFIAHDNTFKQFVRMAEIVDGTSATLAVSEAVQGKGGDLRGFGWWGGGAHFETFLSPNSLSPDSTEQFCRAGVRPNPPCRNRSKAAEETIAARSRHPEGVAASLCDGSVRFFSNSIALDVWRALGTAGGGDQSTIE
jgi:type II secretory pathway pseudopilin PulG